MPDGQQIPEGAVVITPVEMYREMQEMRRSVDHLTTVLDPSLAQIRQDIQANAEHIAVITAERKAEDAKLDGRILAVDIRVRALENWRWFVLGIAAILSVAAGYVVPGWFGT